MPLITNPFTSLFTEETESVVELQLKHNKNMLKNRQRLFLNALKLLESRMEISMNEIETSVKNTIEKKVV